MTTLGIAYGDPARESDATLVLDVIGKLDSTLVQNRRKHRNNSHPIIQCPTSEGVSKVSKRASAAERVGKVSNTCKEIIVPNHVDSI